MGQPPIIEVRDNTLFYTGKVCGKLVDLADGTMRYTSDRDEKHFYFIKRSYGISNDILDFLGVDGAYNKKLGHGLDRFFAADITRKIVSETEIVVKYLGFITILRSPLWRWSKSALFTSEVENKIVPYELQSHMGWRDFPYCDDPKAAEMVEIFWRDFFYKRKYDCGDSCCNIRVCSCGDCKRCGMI